MKGSVLKKVSKGLWASGRGSWSEAPRKPYGRCPEGPGRWWTVLEGYSPSTTIQLSTSNRLQGVRREARVNRRNFLPFGPRLCLNWLAAFQVPVALFRESSWNGNTAEGKQPLWDPRKGKARGWFPGKPNK